MSEPIIIYVDTPTTYRKRQMAISAADAAHRRSRITPVHDELRANVIDDGSTQVDSLIVARPEREVEAFTEENLQAILGYLLDHQLYRDYMLFVVGVNVGLRYSDLARLQFSHFMNGNGTFKDEIILQEQKTNYLDEKHKRKKPRPNRHVYINEAVKHAICLYMDYNPKKLSDFLFTNESSNKSKNSTLYMTNRSMNSIIKQSAYLAGVEGVYGTHSLRKTFGALYMKDHADDPMALYNLMDVYGHSAPKITLKYIGLTKDKNREAYSTNIGLKVPEVDAGRTALHIV